MSIYKRNNKGLKKLALGGINPNMMQQGTQTFDALTPLTQKQYNQDYINSDQGSKMNRSVQNDKSIDQVEQKTGNALLKSGNPYGMIVGAAIKVGNAGSNVINKASTDSYGVTNGVGGQVGRAAADMLDPIKFISHKVRDLKNGDGLSDQKFAIQQKDKYITQVNKDKVTTGQNNYAQALASGFNPNGTQEQPYKLGGNINKSPEGGFVNNAFVMMADGGSLQKLSSENQEVEGNSHAEGGVKFPEQGVELEGKETVNNSNPNTPFVFSKELGFAQKHKPIAKAIGKIEKKDSNNRFDKNSLDRLKQREEDLKVEQEQTKQQLGIPNDLDMKKYGGTLKKYLDGGNLNSAINKTISTPVYNTSERNIEIAKKILLDNPSIENHNAFVKAHKDKAENTNKIGNLSSFKEGGSLRKMISGGKYTDYTQDNTMSDNENSNDPILKTPLRTVTDTTNSNKFTNKNNKNNLESNIPDVSGYADNITNFILNRQRAKQVVPNQGMTSYLTPNKFDFSAQKNEADRQRLGFNKGIEQNTDNSGTANTNKAIGLAETIKAKNEINQNETNANVQEKSRVQGINSSIQTNNNIIGVNNKLRKLGAVDDIRREDSQNMANIVGKQQLAINDNKREQLGRDQNILNLSGQDPKTVAMHMKANRELYKRNGYTDSQIDDFISNSNKKQYGGSLYSKLKAA